MTKKGCPHPDFEANVTVNRLEDSGRFMADIKIKCCFCGQPFQFLGLPMGVNMNGAAVDVDWTELRVAIRPAEIPDFLRGKKWLKKFAPTVVRHSKNTGID